MARFILPLLTDDDRWRRMIFDCAADDGGLQHMNDSFGGSRATIDTQQDVDRSDQEKRQELESEPRLFAAGADRLNLDGTMNGHKEDADATEARRWDQVHVVSRGFHWVQEYPFNH